MNATMEQAETATKTRLYSASSVIDDWPHRGSRYAAVVVLWFVEDRQEPSAPYGECWENYEPSDLYQRGAIDECFTLEEAEALAAYLKQQHGTDCKVSEVRLPMSGNIMPRSWLPLGGGRDCYGLSEECNYHLPFTVRGHYDIRQHELMPDHTAQRQLVKHVLDELKLAADESAIERVALGLGAGGFEIMHTAN